MILKMTQPPAPRIRFGLFEVDARSGELRRNGFKVDLQDQPFQALLLLLENPGQVVTRDELRNRLWPQDTFVDFDRGLNKAINKLRAALRDSADKPRYIETLPQRGYRFIAEVESAAEIRVQAAGAAEVLTLEPIPAQRSRSKYLYYGVAFLVAIVAAIVVTLGVRGVLKTMRDRQAVPAHAAESRLTANSSDQPITSSAISPDGKYLAYTDPTGFYLRIVDGGETHAVSLPKEFDASVESWFPDSVHMVVSWVEDAKRPPSLWVISTLGGTPRKLADVGAFARVSSDGALIAFLKGPWDDNEIWVVDANGNGARKLIDAGSDYFGPVTWAPDKKQFAYVRTSGESATGQIETYDLHNGHTEKILSETGLGPQIAWVPAGRVIYSLAEPQPNQEDANLWFIQLDAQTGRPSGTPARITNDHGGAALISVTSDGRRIALLRCTSQADVYLSEVESQGRKISPPRRFTHDERQDFPSSWTPDSKAVLVVSDRDGPSHIFKQRIDELQPELLVGGKQDAWLPRLTPDGLNMLYLASPAQVGPPTGVRLMRTPLAGGPTNVVLEDAGIVNYQCARLPSTVCIYSRIDAENYRFFKFNPDDGQRTELSSARLGKESGLNNWNLSPNGKYLVRCESQSPYKQTELHIFNIADNTEQHLLISAIKLIMGVGWAADSKSIWVGGYMGRGSWGTRSGLINIDLSGHERTMIAGQSPVLMGSTPSPDGHHLAIGANGSSANVWLVENF
jgi:DNA-binding winged helix-turn-helix (wHTH) protein/Tol biopolymer transport system component